MKPLKPHVPTVHLGIDLGTTYSSLSFFNETSHKSEIVRISNYESIASWVSISNIRQRSGALVGNPAKEDIKSNCVVYDVKRIIGKPFQEIGENEKKELFKKLINVNGKPKICLYNYNTNKIEQFEPEEISGFIVKFLLNEFMKGREHVQIGNVVVTVPAQFDEAQKMATENAALLALNTFGITNVIFKPEPVAAIKYYMNENQNIIANDNKIVVIDFGGGTLDLALCVVENGHLKVIAKSTDQDLGGNDFDNVMKQLIINELKSNELIEEDYFCDDEKKLELMDDNEIHEIQKRMIRLKTQSEQVKKDLSNAEQAEINVKQLLNSPEDLEKIQIARKDFEDASKQLLNKFTKAIKQFLSIAKTRPQQIDKVLLIGGTCKMPMILNSIENSIFKPEKIIKDENFDSVLAVCQGAALYAYQESNKNSYMKETVDVSPFSIYIRQANGFSHLLIKEGTELPFRKHVILTTTLINAKSLPLLFYKQSDYSTNRRQQKVMTMTLDNLPETGEELEIELTVEFLDSGKMTIDAVVTANGKHYDADKELDMTKSTREMERLQLHFNQFAPK